VTTPVLTEEQLDASRNTVRAALLEKLINPYLYIPSGGEKRKATQFIEADSLEKVVQYNRSNASKAKRREGITTDCGRAITLNFTERSTDPRTRQDLVNIAFYNAVVTGKSVTDFRDRALYPELDAIINGMSLLCTVSKYKRYDAALLLFKNGDACERHFAVDAVDPGLEQGIYRFVERSGELVRERALDPRNPGTYSTRPLANDYMNSERVAKKYGDNVTPFLYEFAEEVCEPEQLEGPVLPRAGREASEAFPEVFNQFIDEQLALIP
jgi:hypothetical protein